VPERSLSGVESTGGWTCCIRTLRLLDQVRKAIRMLFLGHIAVFPIPYIDAAYCYRRSSVVCWSVCRSVCLSVCYTNKPCKKGCADRGAVWVENSGGPREPCIRRESRSPMGRGNFERQNGRLIVKYRDTPRSSVQKRLNRSRCRLSYGLDWAVGIMC